MMMSMMMMMMICRLWVNQRRQVNRLADRLTWQPLPSSSLLRDYLACLPPALHRLNLGRALVVPAEKDVRAVQTQTQAQLYLHFGMHQCSLE